MQRLLGLVGFKAIFWQCLYWKVFARNSIQALIISLWQWWQSNKKYKFQSRRGCRRRKKRRGEKEKRKGEGEGQRKS